MEQIVNSMSRLKGVHHASIYKDGEQLASTFAEDQHNAILDSADIISQIFSALEAIEQSHNEIFFSIGKYYLAAYLLNDSYIVVLLTEKKINFPLINMGIKSAAGKIAHRAKSQEREQEERRREQEQEERKRVEEKIREEKAQERELTKVEGSVAIEKVPTNTVFQPVFDGLSNVLTEYLGPAAQFVIDDSIALWKSKYLQNAENLPHLIEFIQNELDDDNEKERFSHQAKTIIEQNI
jgi:predicted regulator of Ras-like GTPase activity (Roadblock/LC7/MglB family)